MSDDAKLILRLEARTAKFEKDLTKAIGKIDGSVKRGNVAFNKGMTKMERRAKRFTSTLSRTLGSVSGLGSIGLGASLAIGAKTIADFRQSMSTVKAVTGATNAEFAELEIKARELGATTRFSASQAADGMVALGRAGFSTGQVLASIEGTLLLAQSGALELGSAADIASNVLQGFRLDAEQAGRAVDVLSLAANSSNTDVEQLGQALSFVAPASASVGVSLEETSAAISALSDAGIQATRAGTGLRHILIQLASNGVDLREESGGLQGALKNLATQNIDLAKASELVGNRQAASLLVLLDSVDKIGTLETAYKGAAGSAAETAAIMDDNLKGALLATKSRLEEMAIALGEAGGEQALIDNLENLQGLLNFVAENADTFNKALIVLAATAAGLIGGKALGGIVGVLGAARTSMLTTAATANVTALSLKNLGTSVKVLLVSLGPVGWVAIAAGAIAAFLQFGGAADAAARSIDNFGDTFADLSRVNKDLQSDTKRLKELTDDLADANVSVGDAAYSAQVLEVASLNARIAKNKELAETYKALLRAQVTAGQAEANSIGRKQLGLTRVVVARTEEAARIQQQEGYNRLLKEANEAATKGLDLTKKQSKALDLHVEQAAVLHKLESARAQLADLEAPPAVVNSATDGTIADDIARITEVGKAKIEAIKLARDTEIEAIKSSEIAEAEKVSRIKAVKMEAADAIRRVAKPSGGSDDKVDKTLERQLAVIAELGKSEREQIADLLATRLSAIEKSKLAEEEKAALRTKANQDAQKEIKALDKEDADAADKRKEEIENERRERFDLGQDQLSYLAEIQAAQTRMAGRALEASRIELDAVKERYEAELAYIDDLIAKRGAQGATPELLADRANAQAGIATADANIQDSTRGALDDFDSLASDSDGELEAELARIDEIELAKMERLEELRTEELEQLRDFEAQKTQIEADANAARREAHLASIKSQLDTTKQLLGGITSALQAAGKENTKAAKIAAKAQQVISLANAVVNTAQGVSQALATGNIPKAILVGALGAIQVGIIASQTFDGGGFTGKGARVGGVDGKGGFYAIMHPNETVIDHTKPNAPIAGKSLEDGLGIGRSLAARGQNLSARGLAGVSQSNSSTFQSGDLVVQGNVDTDTLPLLQAQMDEFRQNQMRDFNVMADARDRRTKPRTERRVGRGGGR